MILIADSGSTKTHWALMTANGHSTDMFTAGINPVHQSEEHIRHVINAELLPQLGPQLWAGKLTHVYFYGAGCTPQHSIKVHDLLSHTLPMGCSPSIEVYSDMLGAARGLLQDEQGIACILGTGSGSCYYDGQEIAYSVPSLGYILGDEGSGARLGIRLVNTLLKNPAYSALREAFYNQYDLSLADILTLVYRRSADGEPTVNRLLASWARFCANKEDDALIQAVLYAHFEEFVTRNLVHYREIEVCPVSFVGGIAHQYRKTLKAVLMAHHISLGLIMQDPISGLKQYHRQDATPTL